jgi:DNA-directed RNA polymerase subunit RPC12/RpoP
MIEFSCFYCGRPMRAAEDLLHQQVQCPDCGHAIMVWRRRHPDATQADRSAARKEKPDASSWEGKSDEEIAAWLQSRARTKEAQPSRTVRMVLSVLLPRCDDLTLFAVSLSFLLLAAAHSDLRRDLSAALAAVRTPDMDWLIGPLVLGAVGLILSLVNVLWPREKSGLERFGSLIFAIGVTAGTGLYAGWSVLQHRCGGLMLIFPACNIFHAGSLLVRCRLGVVDAEGATDGRGSYAPVALTALCVAVLLSVCQYFALPWVLAFSSAVAYVMSLHNALRDVFGRCRPTGVDARR